MGIEGFWTVRFASVAGESLQSESAAVVIFSDGRLLGGDTWSYFVGTYGQADDGSFNLKVHVRTHFTQNGESIFGGPLVPYTLNGRADFDIQSNKLSAVLEVEGLEGARMVAIMRRVSDQEVKDLTTKE